MPSRRWDLTYALSRCVVAGVAAPRNERSAAPPDRVYSRRMHRSKSSPLRPFFLGMTRRACGRLGLHDEPVVGYLASVLTDFAHTDLLYPIKTPAGAPLEGIVETLAAWQARDGGTDPLRRQRAVRRYLGDYTLFMSGLFRSHVERRGILALYLQHGSDAYRKVSELDALLCNSEFLLFEQLSKKFEYYSGALDFMRKTDFTPAFDRTAFAGFLQKVERWIDSGISSN